MKGHTLHRLGDTGTHLCLVQFSTQAYVSVHFFPNLPVNASSKTASVKHCVAALSTNSII